MNFQCELHNFCQFSCGYCAYRLMQRKKQFMDDDVWQVILNDYIVPFRYVNQFCPPTFIPHKDTELLIDRKLPSRLRDLAAVAPDMKVDIYTNGVLLPTWAKRGEDFIDILASLPNQCRLLISYHPKNHDDTWNDYTQVIPYLRDVLRRPPPNIEFISSSHKSKWVTEGMQQAWRQTWEGLPITVHCNTDLTPWAGFTTETATCHYNGCPYADFGHWFFGVTGNVIACCMDLEEEIVFGNVMDGTPPQEMFRRVESFYREQRRTLAAKERPLHAVCDDCFGYVRGERKLVQLGVPA